MNGLKHLRESLDELITPKIKAYNEPIFATGAMGTLHGKRTDLNGYQFFRIHLLGSPEIKSYNGCSAIFCGANEKINFVLKSDTKEIDSYYSQALGRGITEVEFLVDDLIVRNLNNRLYDSITLDFGKIGFFRRKKYRFNIDPAALKIALELRLDQS